VVVYVGGGRTQRSKGGSDSVEGIGRSERRKSSLSNEIAVNEVLQLFDGLPVRRSRRRRSVLRMSLVSAGAGRRELDAERARVAMRTCAKD
jgi:hypothetical protein